MTARQQGDHQPLNRFMLADHPEVDRILDSAEESVPGCLAPCGHELWVSVEASC